MRNIVEFLLSKNIAHDFHEENNEARKELIDKLCNNFYNWGEFGNLKDNGTFTYTAETEDWAKMYISPDILKLAKKEAKYYNGNRELIYTWNIDDIIEFFDYNYNRVFNQIKDWYDEYEY